MARKKISTGVDTPPGVIDLDDDDEIVKTVTTETRVGRQKRRTPVSEPEAVATGSMTGSTMMDFDEELEELHAVPVLEDDPPLYPANSLAAFLYDDDPMTQLANEACTIYIRRNPDSLGDKFRKPCTTQNKLPKLHVANILQTSQEDIEDRVRSESGSGGHYFFQIFQNGRLSKSWSSTLSDPFDVAASSAATTQPAAASTAPPPVTVDPMDSMIKTIGQLATFRELIVGDDLARLKEENAREREEKERIRRELEDERREREKEERERQILAAQSESLQMVNLALKMSDGPLKERLIDRSLSDAEPKGFLERMAESAVDAVTTNPALMEAAAGLVTGLVTRLVGGGQPAPQPLNVAQMMQSQHVPPPVPPPTIPPPAERPFGHLFETPPEPADTEPNTETDDTAIEVVEEAENSEVNNES